MQAEDDLGEMIKKALESTMIFNPKYVEILKYLNEKMKVNNLK